MTGLPERGRTIATTAAVVALGALTVGFLFGREEPWRGLVAGGLMALVGAALVLPQFRTGPHTPWAEARTRVAPGHAVVFWKPGCAYCEVLLRALGPHPRVTWVNVWADPDANAEVRAHNDGNELTPTALVGDRVLANPSAGELRAALESA